MFTADSPVFRKNNANSCPAEDHYSNEAMDYNYSIRKPVTGMDISMNR